MRRQFICRHCGRRVFAEGPLAQVQLCRSCFEKARKAQREADDPKKTESQGR